LNYKNEGKSAKHSQASKARLRYEQVVRIAITQEASAI